MTVLSTIYRFWENLIEPHLSKTHYTHSHRTICKTDRFHEKTSSGIKVRQIEIIRRRLRQKGSISYLSQGSCCDYGHSPFHPTSTRHDLDLKTLIYGAGRQDEIAWFWETWSKRNLVSGTQSNTLICQQRYCFGMITSNRSWWEPKH